MTRNRLVTVILIMALVMVSLTACNNDADPMKGDGLISPFGMENQDNTANDTDIAMFEGTKGKVFVVDDNSIDKNEAAEAMKNPLEGRQVFFAGYVDATITKADAVALENLPENEDFFMVYQITNKADSSMVFETDLIPSGKCVLWSPTETLNAGIYKLQFLAIPYYCDSNGDYQELTSGCTEVCYTIK